MRLENTELALIARTIRTLAMDAVEEAQSGHPGMPMGCADIAAVLWTEFLAYRPHDLSWLNRDRFVLSAGHGSMLLYAMLHLAGCGMSIEDLKNFRRLGSRTPGHPERGKTPGVEATTGPLGQGFANGVGMAIARELLLNEFPELEGILDHRVFALVSDGDIMEGVSAEAASLAGHLGLGSLVYIYDANGISIEGSTALALGENVRSRFEAYGWHVEEADGHDYADIARALAAAVAEKTRPSLVITATRIAKGAAAMEGDARTHGAPLGPDEVAATKHAMGLDPAGRFFVPKEVYKLFRRRDAELRETYDEWDARFARFTTGPVGERWKSYTILPDAQALRAGLPALDDTRPIPTREASGRVLERLFGLVPNLVGGSADLGTSVKAYAKGYGESGRNRIGRNIHFGVREHAMAAIQNGIACYGMHIPYSSTFFIFMDYMRPSMRLAALQGLRTIYLFSHDSLFLGEDGPTHQPVEHLAAARAIPNLHVVRPADPRETAEAWIHALHRASGPTMIVLTRQGVPTIADGTRAQFLHRGAYILKEPDRGPDVLLLASGSEVSLALAAADLLAGRGVAARVVSFPCWELFDAQGEHYKKEVLKPGIPRVVIEAGSRMGWERFAGTDALYFTMDGFGESAPERALRERFGFTAENIAERIHSYVRTRQREGVP
ncbi:MAG: transketolase [Spirochaetes bacterium]|nr:MAG: transketolase [Spirochaetota bacterium]